LTKGELFDRDVVDPWGFDDQPFAFPDAADLGDASAAGFVVDEAGPRP
jgi:hypothetical protein